MVGEKPRSRSRIRIAYESLYNQMNKFVVQPLLRSTTPTAMIIDALDKRRDDEPASAILFVLGQCVSRIPNVKFFLTGRSESRIMQGFRLPSLAPATNISILHEVETSHVDRNRRVFFRHTFSELTTRRHGLDDWPSEQQLDLLCEHTAGLLVYSVASLRFIDHRGGDPKRQLERLLRSPDSSIQWRTKFNTNKPLDLPYISMLQEAFGGSGPEDDPKVRSVLGAVVLAANPLSPSSIATVPDLDIEDVLPPLSSVNSLVLHEDFRRPVRPFHKSFPDFVINPTRCAETRFLCAPLIVTLNW